MIKKKSELGDNSSIIIDISIFFIFYSVAETGFHTKSYSPLSLIIQNQIQMV